MTVAEIEAVIKLKDELTPQLAKAEGSLTHFGSTVVTVSQTSEAALKAIEKANRDVEKATFAMTRAVAQFDGSRVFKEAELMARSIANVGGASALTEKELAKANATITEAIAKYRAMGQDVPAHLLALEGATRKMGAATEVASQQTKNFASTLGGDLKTQILGTMAGFVSAQAILGAVSGTFNTIIGVIGSVKDAFVGAVLSTAKLGDELLGLSNKSGIAVEQLSAWRYVAGQTGLSVDQITSSVFKLQTELGQGGKATTQALNAVGLSLSQLRAMKPDEAFQQVINKLHDVPNAADRAAIGVALFGKSFKDMAALTREDIAGMMQKFDELGGKITTEMAVAGDAFNDAKADWGVLVERMQTSVGSAILPAATAFVQIMVTAVQKSLNDTSVSAAQFQASITRSFAAVVDTSGFLLQAIGLLVSGFSQLFFGKWVTEAGGLVTAIGLVGSQFTRMAEAYALFNGQVEAANVFKKMRDGFVETMKVSLAVTTAGREAEDALASLGAKMQAIGQEMKGKGEAALKAVQAQIAAAALSMRTAQNQLTTGLGLLDTASDKTAKSLAAVRDELTGKGAVVAMEKYAAAVKAAGGLSAVSADGLTKLATAARAALAATVPLTPAAAALVLELMKLGALEPPLTTNNEALVKSLKALGLVAQEDVSLLRMLADDGIRTLNAATREGATDFERMLKGLGTLSTEAPPVVAAAGTIGQAFEAAGQMIGIFGQQSAAAMAASVALSAMAKIAAKDYAGALMGVMSGLASYMEAEAAAERQRVAIYQANRARMFDLKDDLITMYGTLQQIDDIGKLLGVDLAKSLEPLYAPGRQLSFAHDAEALAKQNEAFAREIDKLFAAIEGNAGLASEQLLRVIAQLDTVKESAAVATAFIVKNAQAAATGLNALIGGLAGSDAAKQRAAIEERSAAVKMAGEAEIGAAQHKVEEIGRIEKSLNDELKRLRNEEQTDANKAQQAKIQKDLEALGERKAIYQEDVDNQKQALADKLAAFKADSEGVIGVFMQTETQARGLAAAVVGTFGEMIARGVPLREALEAVQPAITTMQQQLAATGFQGGAAFASLTEMSRIAGDAIMGPAVDAISGARDALTGLHNSGLLNQEMFAGIAMSATQAYDAIVAQGGDGTAALMMMQPTLQTLWKLQEDFGYEVDEGTQKLLDQAEAAGIVGAERMSDAEKQTAAQEKLVEQMGQLLEFFQRLIPVSEHAGDKIASTFEKAGKSAGIAGKSVEDAGQKIKAAKLDQAFKDSEAAAGDLEGATGDVKQSLFDAGQIGVEAWANVGQEAGTAEGHLDLLKGATDTLYETFDGYDFSESIRKITSDAEDARTAVSHIYDDFPTAPTTTATLPMSGFSAPALAQAAAPRASGGDLRVPVYLDGRQIAEAVYADLPGVLQARGVL